MLVVHCTLSSDQVELEILRALLVEGIDKAKSENSDCEIVCLFRNSVELSDKIPVLLTGVGPVSDWKRVGESVSFWTEASLSCVVRACGLRLGEMRFLNLDDGEEECWRPSSCRSETVSAIWTLLQALDETGSTLCNVRSKIASLKSIGNNLPLSPAKAALRKSSSYILNFLDLEKLLWNGEHDLSSGALRACGDLKLLKKSPVFENIAKYRVFIEDAPKALGELAKERERFLEFGVNASKIAGSNPREGAQKLIGWWASYFSLRAAGQQRDKDYSAAASSLVRAVELLAMGTSLERSVGEFSMAGEFLLNGKKCSGVGALVSEVGGLLGNEVERSVTELIGCRNKSYHGHGASPLNKDICSQGFSALSRMRKELSGSGHITAATMDNLIRKNRSNTIINPLDLFIEMMSGFKH